MLNRRSFLGKLGAVVGAVGGIGGVVGIPLAHRELVESLHTENGELRERIDFLESSTRPVFTRDPYNTTRRFPNKEVFEQWLELDTKYVVKHMGERVIQRPS